MAFVPIPNSWRVSLVFQYDDTELLAVNTFGVRDGGAHTIEEAGVVAGIFATWWSTHIKSLTEPKCALIQINVLDMNDELGVSLEYTTGLPMSGTGDAGSAPQNAAPIVTFRSEGRGRSSRGRNYIVGAGQGFYSAGDGTDTNPTVAALYQTAYEALGTAIAAEDMDHAILSKTLALPVVVTSYQVRSYIGTQRRRVKSP